MNGAGEVQGTLGRPEGPETPRSVFWGCQKCARIWKAPTTSGECPFCGSTVDVEILNLPVQCDTCGRRFGPDVPRSMFPRECQACWDGYKGD